MSDYELLTYREIADRMRIKLASARQTVSRRKWKRVKANDGTVRVEVPSSYLQANVVDVDEVVDINVDVDMAVEIASLRAENTYLAKRVADLETDRNSWRELANRSWLRRLVGG